MKGCLTLPFRLLALALLALGLYVAWARRDAIRRWVHEWTAERAPAAAEPVGLGDPARAPAVRAKLAGLTRAGVDSIVLSARELADLVAEAAARRLPGALDSIEVELGGDEVELRGRLDTRRVPLSFGPLTGVLRDYERVEVGGRLSYRRPGLAEWEVTRARVRGVPLPGEAVRRLVGSLSGGERERLPLALPPAVGGWRVSAAGLVLYPLPRPAR